MKKVFITTRIIMFCRNKNLIKRVLRYGSEKWVLRKSDIPITGVFIETFLLRYRNPFKRMMSGQ